MGDKGSRITDIEELIMRAVLCKGNRATGKEIREVIEETTGETLTLGTIYVTGTRLEEKGFVISELGEVTPERGGRRKQYFSVDATGELALQEKERNRNAIWKLVPQGGLS